MNTGTTRRVGADRRSDPLWPAASIPSSSTASPAAARRKSTCGPSRKSSSQGKEAIVLVPEISLTPQTIERFRGRCGSVAVLHSHLTDAERGRLLAARGRGPRSGRRRGAISAVFAPTRKLGLIVIDEEHETTFKQESDAAVPRPRRCDHAGAPARGADHPRLRNPGPRKLAGGETPASTSC